MVETVEQDSTLIVTDRKVPAPWREGHARNIGKRSALGRPVGENLEGRDMNKTQLILAGSGRDGQDLRVVVELHGVDRRCQVADCPQRFRRACCEACAVIHIYHSAPRSIMKKDVWCLLVCCILVSSIPCTTNI